MLLPHRLINIQVNIGFSIFSFSLCGKKVLVYPYMFFVPLAGTYIPLAETCVLSFGIYIPSYGTEDISARDKPMFLYRYISIYPLEYGNGCVVSLTLNLCSPRHGTSGAVVLS